jgi:hypothetical protein
MKSGAVLLQANTIYFAPHGARRSAVRYEASMTLLERTQESDVFYRQIWLPPQQVVFPWQTAQGCACEDQDSCRPLLWANCAICIIRVAAVLLEQLKPLCFQYLQGD